MLAILCSWIIITVVFLAFGEMLGFVWNKVVRKNTSFSFYDTFWLGLCAVGAISCIISLFLPVSIYVLISFVVISVIYWLINKKKLVSYLRQGQKGFSNLSKWNKAGILLVLSVILIYSLSIPYKHLYDPFLYHLQSLMWTEQYSVVPGLGNLHGRLAFNSNYLLLSTLFSYHPDYYMPVFALSGLCLIVFSCWLIAKMDKLKSDISSIILYLALFIFIFIFRHNISTTSTDLLAGIFVLYIVLGLALRNSKDHKMFVLCVMSVFCITLKLSAAPVLLIALFALIYFIRNKNFKPVYLLLVVGSVIIIPWCVRFIILSGYLVYPFPAIDLFSVDWKIPEAMVTAEKNAAYAWAKIQNVDAETVLAMPFYEWIPRWASAQSLLTLCLFVLAFISPIVVLIRKNFFKKNTLLLIAWIVALCGVFFGFFTAPDIRFSLGFILSAICIPLLLTSFIINKFISLFYKGIRIVRSGLILLGSLLLLSLGVRQLFHYKTADENLFTFVIKPQSVSDVEKAKNIRYDEIDLNGLTIYVPAKGDQCFEQCLPCAPYFNDRLEMRGETLQDGFRMKK